MRKVEYKIVHQMLGLDLSYARAEDIDNITLGVGYLHAIISSEGQAMAVIERLDGRLKAVPVDYVRFITPYNPTSKKKNRIRETKRGK